MAAKDFHFRVRPHKVAVLIPWDATAEQCLLSIKFLSQLWGGRYCPIIPVKPEGDNILAKDWLRTHQPDAVYGLEVDHETWSRASMDCCQPYGYETLSESDLDKPVGSTPLNLIDA